MEMLKLAAESVAKPWGLNRGAAESVALRPYGVAAGTGELWLASAQTGPGNYSNPVVQPPLRKRLADVADQASAAGEGELRRLLGGRALAILNEMPHRGKTEAWMVREAVGHTGVASGPRTPEDLNRLKELVLRRELKADIENWPPDVRRLLGLIEPLKGGEVFLVPCGTLHTMFAIGPDGRLVIDEIQQGYGTSLVPTLSKVLMVQDSLLSVQVHPCDETVSRVASGELRIDQDLEANPTVRVYDFGRRPGEYPELGFKLTDMGAGLRRVSPVEVNLADGAILEVTVACPQFVRIRLRLRAGAVCAVRPAYGSYRVLHCASGACRLESGSAQLPLAAAETAFVPAELEPELLIRAEGDSLIFDDAVPDLDVLNRFLGDSGVSPSDTAALLDPPRALAGSE